MKKGRLAGLDLVRATAIIFVVILHSTTLSGILSGEILTAKWSITVYLRHLTFCSVPLFIMLTGYLQRNKKLSLTYYKGIIPLIVSYTLISIISLLAKTYFDKSLVLSPAYILRTILDFTANDYAWYFEMYIGLFLMVPFLNYLYNGLNSRRAKLALIFTLSFLTLVPQTLLSFSPAYGSGNIELNILPDFFTDLYALTYYFIGAYFAQYKPFSGNRLPKIIAAVLAPCVPALLCFAFSNARGAYAWYMMNGFNTLTVALTGVCIFALLYDADIKFKPIRFCVSGISKATFEIYLLSFIFDLFVYNKLACALPLKAIIVFSASLACALVLRFILINPINSVLTKIYMYICNISGRKAEIYTNSEQINEEKIVISQIDTELKK
ncbi:MAG: hypothetical protein E7635_03660 [Ruminococcaceae bacterium]|nr:hypothetical protein [Oscillospiraceae bacterium]